MIDPAPSRVAARNWIGLAALASLAVFATYGPSLYYGLAYDDYFLSRPWTITQLERVWHSTWDPTRISVTFYRPLTAWWYAIRFELFGVNGFPQHLISLLGMTVCATLADLFVRRELQSRSAAFFTTLLYAIHPGMAYGQAAWLTNQMHVLASFFVLLGLLAWQTARRRGPAAWLLVLLCQVIAFGIKEDTIMLVPVVLGLAALRRLVLGDVTWPPWIVLGIGAVTPIALFAFRLEVLGRVGGYGASPGLDAAWSNFSRAFSLFTLLPARRPWQEVASLVGRTLLFVGGAVSLLRRRTVYLLLVGLWLFTGFNLPFILVTKAEQMHLVTLGVAVTLAACCEALLTLVRARRLRWAAAAAVTIPVLSFSPLARHVGSDYSPCSAITLATDQIVTGWFIVPPEIKAWLQEKPARCAAGTLQPISRGVDTSTWAYGPQPAEDGRVFQWTSAEATVLTTRSARSLSLLLRRPAASDQSPVDVTIRGPVSTTTERLTSGEWQAVTIPLAPTWRSWMSDMHRVDIDVAQTFVPFLADRTNADRRRLGVQLRIGGVER